jgi:protein-S-isoprenylcysteine O-methyltransferase Ste14
MKPTLLLTPLFMLLAFVFTVGLTFASVELPYVLDEALQKLITTPGDDSHANAASVYRTELFIDHFHLRPIGYACFGLTLLLIIAGFATQKSGFAALGAVALMLPVFAQFASVMFFLAGLGALNLLWLPVLDISFDVQRLGLIIRAPYDLVMWLFRLAGVNAYWPLVYLCIGGGLLLFFFGTYAWLSARAHKQNVADSWVYKYSRHPQYLGWILWTYGLFLLLMRARYPKRSWGIDASLPWLISTMVIIGVAMLEELAMQHRYGESYEGYRKKTPFFFPLPAGVVRLLNWPFRLFFGKERPDRAREVALVVSVHTLLLIGLSAFFYGSGANDFLALVTPPESRRERMEAIVAELKENPNRRQRYFIAERLAAFGEGSSPYFIQLLHDENPDIRASAAEKLGDVKSQAAVPALIEVLSDPVGDVRQQAARALGRIGAPEAKVPLLGLADDPDRVTRRIVNRALTELKAEEVVGHLVVQLRDSLVWVRIGAAEDLGVFASKDAVPVLVEQLNHENPALRRAVVVALMQIGAPDALPALREAAYDEDWEVRVYAAEAVKHLEAAADRTSQRE